MSAYIVDRAVIDALVSLSINGPSGSPVQPGSGWSLSWWDMPPESIHIEIPDGATAEEKWRAWSAAKDPHYHRADHESADRIGAMLIRENVASVAYRYPDDTDETRPGPRPCYWLEPYAYRTGHDPLVGSRGQVAWSARRPTAVEGLKLADHFEYQACEHPGWEASEAKAFLEALRGALGMAPQRDTGAQRRRMARGCHCARLVGRNWPRSAASRCRAVVGILTRQT